MSFRPRKRETKARVLIVDGAIVVRRVLSDVFRADPGIEVLQAVATLAGASTAIDHKDPELVILGLDLDSANVLEFLRRLRLSRPRMPVIVQTQPTKEGARLAIKAMGCGASESLAKPVEQNPQAWAQHGLEVLLPMIKSIHFGTAFPGRRVRTRTEGLRAAPLPGRRTVHPIQAVMIASSTGGPEALAQIFDMLPADLGAALLVVQHMPPKFTEQLAIRLNRTSRLEVAEGYRGAPVRPGLAWLAPGGAHMIVRRGEQGVNLDLNSEATEHGVRPAADPLLRTMVEIYGPRMLAVILTGMGSDGLHGCRLLRSAGGRVFAQDQASSVVWGMPGVIAHEGLAECVLPLDRVATAIVDCVRSSRDPSQHGSRRRA